MVHFPLLAKTCKFVLSTDTTSFKQANFTQQAHADLFTPVFLPSIIQYLVAQGKLTTEQAQAYPDNYYLTPEKLEQDQVLIDALIPWFDVREYFKHFTNEQGELTSKLSIYDLNQTISTLNLLKHLYHDSSVALDEWIVVCDQHTILSPEWANRLESILSLLAPTTVSLTQALNQQLAVYQAYTHANSDIEQAITKIQADLQPSPTVLASLEKLNFISLNNNFIHNLELNSAEHLANGKIYLSQELATNPDQVIASSYYGQQNLGVIEFLNFTQFSFFMVRKRALEYMFGKDSEYLDAQGQPVLTPITSHQAIYTLEQNNNYQTLEKANVSNSNSNSNFNSNFDSNSNSNSILVSSAFVNTRLASFTKPMLDALSQARASDNTQNPLSSLTPAECNLVKPILNSQTPNFHDRAFSTLSPWQAYLALSSQNAALDLGNLESKANSNSLVNFSQVLTSYQQDPKLRDQVLASLNLPSSEFAQSLAYSVNSSIFTKRELGILAKRVFSLYLDQNLDANLVAQLLASSQLVTSDFSCDPSILAQPQFASQLHSGHQLTDNQAQLTRAVVLANAQVLYSAFSYNPDQAYYQNLEQAQARHNYFSQLTIQNLNQTSHYYRSHFSSYQEAKHLFTRLLSFSQPLACRLDHLHLWLQFTTGSLGTSNPILAWVGAENGIDRYSNATLLQISQVRNQLNHAQLTKGQFKLSNRVSNYQQLDYVHKYRKFVLHDTTRNYLASFLRQPQAGEFEIVTEIDSRTLSRSQVEQYFTMEGYVEDYTALHNHTVHLQQISRTLTYRQLFARILHDQTIADNDFIIVAEDNLSLHEQWYNYLNASLDYVNLALNHCDLLLLTLPQQDDLTQVSGSLEQYQESGYYFKDRQADVITVLPDLELIKMHSFSQREYPFFCVRKRALRYFEEKVASFTASNGYYADNFVKLLAEFVLGSMVVTNPILGKDLHPQQPRYTNVPALNYCGQTTNQAIIPVKPNSELTGFNPLACALTDPQFTGKLTNDPTIDELYFGKNVDISEVLSEDLKQTLAQRPLGFSSAGFSEDLVSRVKKYVINLPSSTDRLNAFLQQNNCEDFNIHRAVVGRELTEDQISQLFNIEQFSENYGNRKISLGELGCSLSHVQILRRAIQDPDLGLDDWVMVVEDDTRLHPQWYQLLNQILIYVRDFMHDRPCIINGAQNQIADFKLHDVEGFCNTHVLLSHVDGYHQISEQVGLGFTQSSYPAGAGFYLVRKRLLVENRQIIEGKVDWVADDFAHYYPFRHYSFAYTNPMLGFDDPKLESILEEERVAGIAERKRKLQAIPITEPSEYINLSRVWIKQMPGQDLASLQQKFKDCKVFPFVDYSNYSRQELEEIFDFEEHQKIYSRDPTIDEINASMQEFNLFKTIASQKHSDFLFHFIARGDCEFKTNWLHYSNCIADYLDTRLDLNTIIAYIGNQRAPQDFSKVSTVEDFAQRSVYTQADYIYAVNDDLNLCYTTRMTTNGDLGYVLLKFYCTHMFKHLPHGKPFVHAGDLVFMTPYDYKTIVFSSPTLVAKH